MKINIRQLLLIYDLQLSSMFEKYILGLLIVERGESDSFLTECNAVIIKNSCVFGFSCI